MLNLEKKRTELAVTVSKDLEYRVIYRNRPYSFFFTDENNILYIWDTNSKPEIYKDEKWLLRMTIIGQQENSHGTCFVVRNVQLVKKLS